ncbi:phosphopantetheine-binding protein [Streptomyces endophytica]|uniref:Phosphopantetheine-binding protein n=1 Tax=Streptomyces endophytica TaxID=2991496 RepID=A0ABY6PKP0_9ACTN|nr:phosphopantetheine-binding protein [Streptomyces endophytica]UZJ34142.1 phosphopantetheine-binding protein [Streptomyces endophytica]
MVPGALVHLTTVPVTVNGKLDRKALPDPGVSDDGAPERVAPETELQAQLCALWAECLGLGEGELGIRDDVTRLGMDSIVAIRLASRMRQRLGVAIGVRTCSRCPPSRRSRTSSRSNNRPPRARTPRPGPNRARSTGSWSCCPSSRGSSHRTSPAPSTGTSPSSSVRPRWTTSG